ncbi:hypothetical protein ABEV78_12315 [Bacillus licheniformis]|jgi:hypothetical protein|uniref:hypothetical protein n=1 Tax=Bacillus TaxID=1386 RepID=UPI0009B7B6AE|nr:hypothetical protein [Bacillus licheniformis]ARC67860.1 hypothetical protein B34_00417 [Bacillus licheniformis]MDE1421367.1 hypothetical protein [Bacillus licheniformis]TWL68785.1 hypothetical protein CHCC15318_1527 [Bacillus licheniformis]TWM60003.1 hypothetical protein CHCC14813_4179 [Bacillus licheniformis]TWM60360.1 hypothetical protein CHCC14810_1017 [Bacillus licheniformis]
MNFKQIKRDAVKLLDQIYDCFVSVYGRVPNKIELKFIAKALPAEINFLADQWGWNDTEVGEKVFYWIEQMKAEKENQI